MRSLVAAIAACGVVALGAADMAPGVPPSPQSEEFALAAAGALKINVNANGWYSLTGKQLAAAGFKLDGEANNLQLFTDGKQVPILVSGVKAKHLTGGGSLAFYGLARNTRYTDVRTYWLVYGSEPGERIEVTRTRRAGGLARARSFSFTSVHRDRVIYAGWASLDPSHFFGQAFNPSSGPIAQTILAPDLDPKLTRAVLQVAVHGVTTKAHEVKLTLNGTPLRTLSYTGQIEYKANLKVPRGVLKEGANTLTLAPGTGELDFQLVDELHLTYARLFRAQDDFLNFVVPRGHAALVAGFTKKSIRLIDISDRSQPRYVVPRVVKGGGSYVVVATAGATLRRYVALTAAGVRKPLSVAVDRPSSWHEDKHGADLVIVTNSKYTAALAPFKAFKEQQGMKVALVDAGDVYDEFSYGAHGPDAIKSFTAWIKDHWHPAPHYLLLVGGATYDPRNFLGKNVEDQVPTNLIRTDLAEFPSDELYGDFNNDGLPEMSVARLPVRTVDQAQLVVSKILAYEQGTAAPANDEALLVADARAGEEFNTPVAALKPLFPAPFSVNFVRRSDGPTDAAVRKQLLTKLGQGPAVVNYFGHGAINLWSEGGLLESSDAPNLQNTNSLSVYVMMTCINADFVDPRVTSLAEALLTRTPGGAVATIGASSLTSAASQPIHNQAFYRELFSSPTMTLGQALDASRSATNDVDLRRTQMLFGDPTMRLRY